METITIRKMKPKYIEVQSDEFENIETYKASDGKIFAELRDATQYEAELKFGKAEKIFFWFPMIDDVWYKAKNEDELEFLKNHVAKTYGRRYGESHLKVGEWFTVVHKDRDGNGNLADHFVSLSKLKESFYELLKILETGE
jgi:hypothetical protein